VTARIAEARAAEASGDFEAALVKMRAAVAAHPKSGEARAILANLLAQAGLSEDAATEFERASELTLDMNSVWIGITTNRKLTAGDDALIARMQAALDQPRLMPRHRQMLHFALGKAHDDRGEYESAMRNFEEGNQLRGMGGEFDRESLARRVDQIIEATPPSFWNCSGDVGVEDATPILIVGMPRSGSTLTEQILSSHPDVVAGGELGFWSSPQILSQHLLSLAGDAEAAKRVANDYIATLRAFDPAAKRVTDKALANFFLLGIIHRILPNATLIHCRRHPIDTALSIFTTNFETNFDYASSRGDLVFYYRQYARLMDHWRNVLPPGRLVEVDYESLVSDPEPHARRLVAACGLDWNDACLAPHRNTRKIKTASVWQARQPIYRTSVERWRRYEPWLGELRELAPEMH
jgi:tetratricopeptide (TPR) repeat protein